jgi:hypothetical protein
MEVTRWGHNQIDILIQRKHSSNLKDVRRKRGVNVDSDHYLVLAEIQARISMNKIHKGQSVLKYNVQSGKRRGATGLQK